MIQRPKAVPKELEYPRPTIKGGDATISKSAEKPEPKLSRDTIRIVRKIAQRERLKRGS